MENGIKLGGFLFRYYWRPLFVFIALSVFLIFVPLLKFPIPLTNLVRQVLAICIISAVSWLCVRLMTGLEAYILNQYDLSVKDNLKARKMHTQLRVINKIVIIFILVIGFCAVLMTFDRVRQLGMSLLASAGIIGIIIGFAAQRSLATLFSGLQIAITQPIRIDDVVIVENEWGRIEEITLTYVVVRIWDLRRLIVPITYFHK